MTNPDALTTIRRCLLLGHVLLISGCAGYFSHQQGLEMLSQGKPEDALPQFEKAYGEAPENREFKVHYLNTKAQVIGRLLADAQYEKQMGHFDAATALFRRVLTLERNNAQANAGLVAVDQERRQAGLLAEARSLFAVSELDAAERKLGPILQENPRHAEALALRRQIEEKSRQIDPVTPALRKIFQKPVSLVLRDTSLKQVLEALSQHTGLNFVVDKDVPASLTVTVFLRDVSVADALDVIFTSNQLRRRILNDTTLLIYPDTTTKQEEHQGLVVKNFFLANAEAKQVMTMLKTVLKAKNLFADDKLNLLVVRDTPEMVRLVERMVSIQDVSEPEVMLELEVLEIQRSRLLNLGIQFPEQLSLAPLPAIGTILRLRDLERINSTSTGATISNTVINLQNVVSDTNLLANPRIRTHNREKALIRIGDRVPVITNTSTSTGFVAESVQYIDVGLKLEVEPTIFPNDEISIKLALEVSSVTKEILSKSGTLSYQIGGRNASTVLRLKDGETQILGGLINDQDIQAANRFPGLGALPLLGRLFSTHKDTHEKTELVLSITPRLVRGLAPPAQIPSEFWSGTENDPRLNAAPLSRIVQPEAAVVNKEVPTGSPASAAAAPAGPALPVLRWTGPASVKAGNTFKVQLKVSSAQPVSRLPLQIAYDTDVFELIKVEPGRFMAQGNAVAEITQRLEAESGTLYMTQTRSGKLGATGSGELLEIEFRALKSAQDSLINVLPREPEDTETAPPAPFRPAAMTMSVTP